MREIKFRAWNRLEYGFVYSNKPSDFGFWKWVAYDDTTPLMQYTGLKDKKGREIYEGDVIKEWWNKLDNPHITTIVYYKNGFYLDDGLHSNWNAEDVEVIGNIWENPGLLEEPKHEEQ